MTAKQFVQSRYPNSQAFSMIDNLRRQNSYVIFKGAPHGLEIITNDGATTASKAWTDAKEFILKEEEINNQPS